MPLPPPAPRAPQHTRTTVFRGYRRDDGLWDIEGELLDTKSVPFEIPGDGVWQPGEAIHGLKIRVTIDPAFTVRDIAVSMDDVPHPECPQAQAPMRRMIGATMGPGWRKAIDEAMGGVRGCTHVRELILAMATVAYQTIPNYRAHERRERGEPTRTIGKPGHQIGKCLGWDTDGPVVARLTPELVGWRPQSWSRLFEHAGARDKWMGCGVRVLLGPLPGRRRRPPVGHVLMA